MRDWISRGTPKKGFPTIHVVSDSVGKLATDLAVASAVQFDNMDPAIEIFSEVKEPYDLTHALNKHLQLHRDLYGTAPFIVFYTLVGKPIRKAMKAFIQENDEVRGVDLLDSPIDTIRDATGMKPLGRAGAFRKVDDRYFRRIEAIEFTVNHDDGLLPEDLPKADIVILGVSRTSKTPTSVYLGQQGYKVANVPIVEGLPLPKEIYEVNHERLFGLITEPSVLVGMRRTRMKGQMGNGKYSDIDAVTQELNRARAIMRGLGCVIINTKDRAIEETAQEILRRYSCSFPSIPLS
jgi:regulator of PEP synthase PpsR (kinase-PPPase family)